MKRILLIASLLQQFSGAIDGMGIATGVPTQSDLDALWNNGNGRDWY